MYGDPVSIPIVIVSYNRKDMLKNCLISIRKNTVHPYKLVLIDNGSASETAEFIMAQENMPDVYNVTRLQNNQGFANGYSQGLKIARGINSNADKKYMVILNNDTVVYPDWLKILYSTAIKYYNIGLVLPFTSFACNPEIVCTIEEISQTSTAIVKSDVPAICWLISELCYDSVCNIMERIEGGHQFFHSEFKYGWAEDMLTSQIIQRLSFDTYVSGNSFIYHHGNATQSILEVNEDYRGENGQKLDKYIQMLYDKGI